MKQVMTLRPADAIAAGLSAETLSKVLRHAGVPFSENNLPETATVPAVCVWGFDALLAVDRLQSGIIAFDGPCASGKTTLAQYIADVLGLCQVHIDDFFLRPEQIKPERYAQPGGNIDWERFREEALLPLQAGRPFAYRPLDWKTHQLTAPKMITPTPVSIVEGVYSMHPSLRDQYTLAIFVEASLATRRGRLLRRNGEAMLARFDAEWIPREELYFASCGVRDACQVRISTEI